MLSTTERRVPHPSPAPLTTYAYLSAWELTATERRGIRDAVRAARAAAGLDQVSVVAFVSTRHDRRGDRGASFSEPDGHCGHVFRDVPGRIGVVVGDNLGRSRRDLAHTIAHEVRHLAQAALAPSVWSDTQLREVDADAFAERVVGDLVAHDSWWSGS